MDEGVFVGGAPPHIDAFESKVGTANGFHGCIRKAKYCNPITQTQTAPLPNIREIDLSTGRLYKHGTKLLRP
ncbi:hypothetical protein ANCCEY_09247 [Ancylostoma ceylanicum]|uniref:Laminin G domain-containing protein n=1 Tax=Ancylostoma ceylanicum TaxID=53326 RepID=A0A0D6LVK9_9BILA|nr:hypothetical protein ANCCEY_09247 [Ancylostoma ceylanicum]